jgi:hypothetical protein
LGKSTDVHLSSESTVRYLARSATIAGSSDLGWMAWNSLSIAWSRALSGSIAAIVA